MCEVENKMDALISKIGLKAGIQTILNDSTCPLHIAAEIEQYIELAPVVDAAPVVHGRWIDIPDKPEWDQKMCSVCGDYFCCQNNYCPNCGAKMDGERREEDE